MGLYTEQRQGWHGGQDEEGLDSDTILMPDYKGKAFPGGSLRLQSGQVHRQQNMGMGLVCVRGVDAGQTPDAVNYLYFCHNARNLHPWARG
ncbi:MAG: hypothetical protein ACLRI7_15875 [Ruthenibacterium lactatiformans]